MKSTPPAPAPTSRQIASEVVRRVLVDDAFAAAALSAEFERHPQISGRQRAAATDLVYGALRAARYLDGRLVRLDAGAAIDPPTRAVLWVAGYELAFRPASPAHAVVDAAVDAAKAYHVPSGRFVNALLRKLATDLTKDPAPSLPEAFVAGAPRWLRRALDRAMGAGEAARFLAAGPWPPPLGLRVRRGERDEWITRLREAIPDATFEPSPVSGRAIRCGSGGGDPQQWPGVVEGDLVVQEEGSQAVAEALPLAAGDRVLDACAGRGNKTLALVDRLRTIDVAAPGVVDAADLHAPKLVRLRDEAARLGVTVGQTLALDASVGLGGMPSGQHDRVLIDAPCSGTGTLRRRPEIVLRRVETDLLSLQAQQRAIVRTVAAAVRPGGTLLYAVCSVLAEECEQVLDGLEGFTLRELRRLLPQNDGCDGYALARLERTS